MQNLVSGRGWSREVHQTRARDTVPPHEHLDCQASQRKWLERRLEQAATMRPHTYCVTCGRVRNIGGPRAKKLGFYLSGLSALKEHLRRSARYRKMTQSESHLLTQALEGLEDFEDSYGLSLEAQAQLYVEAVKRVRPDLEDELVLRLLPTRERRSKKPFAETVRGE